MVPGGRLSARCLGPSSVLYLSVPTCCHLRRAQSKSVGVMGGGEGGRATWTQLAPPGLCWALLASPGVRGACPSCASRCCLLPARAGPSSWLVNQRPGSHFLPRCPVSPAALPCLRSCRCRWSEMPSTCIRASRVPSALCVAWFGFLTPPAAGVGVPPPVEVPTLPPLCPCRHRNRQAEGSKVPAGPRAGNMVRAELGNTGVGVGGCREVSAALPLDHTWAL